MTWIEATVNSLAKSPICDYASTGPGASEPTALAALALVGHDRTAAAQPAAKFLLSLQAKDGSIGIRPKEPWPQWPTSLALLVWKLCDPQQYATAIKAALHWALLQEGERIPREAAMGHDSTLAAWPWVEGTHSWMEPSAFFTLALKAHGLRENKRTQEAIRLLIDRLLKEGGCNYGNTAVLGQTLRPHVQPSGIVMLALAGEADPSGRISKTLDYLTQACTKETTPQSLAWALLGLAAHDRTPEQAPELIAAAYETTAKRSNALFTQTLLVHAALGKNSPLVQLAKATAP